MARSISFVRCQRGSVIPVPEMVLEELKLTAGQEVNDAKLAEVTAALLAHAAAEIKVEKIARGESTDMPEFEASLREFSKHNWK